MGGREQGIRALLLLTLAVHCCAQTGSAWRRRRRVGMRQLTATAWTSVAYVDGGLCEAWGGAQGTPCEGTHYFTSFEEQGGALDLQFMDFSPAGNCQTTGLTLRLLGAFAGSVQGASYFIDVAIAGQPAASVPLNPETYTSGTCDLLEEIPVTNVALNATTYRSSAVNSLTLTPSDLAVAQARFCAVEVTGQYRCTTPACSVCDAEGDCEVADIEGCCNSNDECAAALQGSETQSCLLPHCDGTTNQCMNVWICTDPAVGELQQCTDVGQCADVSSYCSTVECEDERCVTEAILPLQPGCCNVASDCTPAVCAVAACDYVRHLCVYKPLSGCATPTATPSMSKSGTPSVTPSSSLSPTATTTATATTTSTMSESQTPTQSSTPTPTATMTPTPTLSMSEMPALSPNATAESSEPVSSGYETPTPTDPGSSGTSWGLIVMGIILVIGLATLAAMGLAGYGFYRYKRRATFIYPEDYIEDEEFPM